MPRLLPLRPLAAGVAVVVALALGACSQEEDVTRERFQADLEERTGVPEDAAACMTDAIFEDYDQAEVNRIYTAATEDELTNERRDELLEVNDRCLAENPPDDAEDGSDAGSDGEDGGS